MARGVSGVALRNPAQQLSRQTFPQMAAHYIIGGRDYTRRSNPLNNTRLLEFGFVCKSGMLQPEQHAKV